MRQGIRILRPRRRESPGLVCTYSPQKLPAVCPGRGPGIVLPIRRFGSRECKDGPRLRRVHTKCKRLKIVSNPRNFQECFQTSTGRTYLATGEKCCRDHVGTCM